MDAPRSRLIMCIISALRVTRPLMTLVNRFTVAKLLNLLTSGISYLLDRAAVCGEPNLRATSFEQWDLLTVRHQY